MSLNKLIFFTFPALFAIGCGMAWANIDSSVGFGWLSYTLVPYFSFMAFASLIEPELDYFQYGLPLERGSETRPSDIGWGSTSPYVYPKAVRELAMTLVIPFFEYQGNMQAVIGLSTVFTLVKVADAVIVAWKGGERAYLWKSHGIEAFWLGAIVVIRSYE
jgi:hypothetical protein